MKREIGNMWSILNVTDFFIFTGNSFVRADGDLVMGRGMASQVRQRFPSIAAKFGAQTEHLGHYALHFVTCDGYQFGAFQVKCHFINQADLELITLSTQGLRVLANELPDKRFDMNYPGIGYGRREMEEVAPIIEILPDNVHIWSY